MSQNLNKNPARNVGGNLHEQGFNYALAKALRNCNPAWRKGNTVAAERTVKRKRVDISIKDGNMPEVAIECAYGGDDGTDAVARIKDKATGFDTAISINIPREFERVREDEAGEMLINGVEFGYAMLQKDGYRFPTQGYLTGNVRDLTAFIQVSAAAKPRVDAVGLDVVELIRSAAEQLSTLPKDYLSKIAALMSQRTTLSAMHTTSVLWLDAMLVQNMICRVNTNINPLPSYQSPPRPLLLAKEWRKILDINWHSIFKPAVAALEIAGTAYKEEVGRALSNLLEAVEIINTSQLGSQFNVGAELFPKISEDRKAAAAFYTLPATAELLASITIQENDPHDWMDVDLFKSTKVADFACGTGTLLRAASHRIIQFHITHSGKEDGLETLYRDTMERGLVGADVSPIAAHLAVSSLVIAGNGKPYGEANIGFLNVGNPDRVGSLEFLIGMRQTDDLMSGTIEHTLSGESKNEEKGISAPDNSFDYVLMNPPYSRTHKGQGAFNIAGLTPTERKACQERWRKLTKNYPVDNKAGMAASFLCVARNKIKPGGRIGFVLPLTAAFSKSWSKTRGMLVTEFENIIALTAPRSGLESNLSADTGMGEMLLIATKRKPKNHHRKTKLSPVLCVLLNKMPLRCGEAGEYGRSLTRAIDNMSDHICYIRAGNTEIGRAIDFTPDQAGSPWSHLGAHNLELADIAHLLTQGVFENIRTQQRTKIKCPMTVMQDLFKVGPTHHLIGHPDGRKPIGALTLHPITDKGDAVGKNRALWAAQGKEQTKLCILPTHKGEVSDKTALYGINTTQGTLHYARGLRWTSQALVAATTIRPAFGGSAWTTLLADGEDLKRAFSLWANSTYGAMVYWTQGSRTQKGRSRMQVDAIKDVPVPDLRKLPKPSLAKAAGFFDSISNRGLLPVCQLHNDKARHEIDQAVSDMLGIPYQDDAMQDLRRAWCEEPSVHGGNRIALALLRESDST